MARKYSVFLSLHGDLKPWNYIYAKVSCTLIVLEGLDSKQLGITSKFVEDSCFSQIDA